MLSPGPRRAFVRNSRGVDIPNEPGKPVAMYSVSGAGSHFGALPMLVQRQEDHILEGLGQSLQPLGQRQGSGRRRSHGDCFFVEGSGR